MAITETEIDNFEVDGPAVQIVNFEVNGLFGYLSHAIAFS